MARPKKPLRERRQFTTGEVADWLGLHIDTVAKKVDRGEIPAVRTSKGGRRYISRETVVEMLKERGIEVPGVWPEMQRILLVDDDPRVRRLIRENFARHKVPIEIQEASTIEEAITSIARGNRPKLVVLDWHFKDSRAMQGVDAVKYLKKAPDARGIEVVLFTGKDIYEARATARRYGIRDVIQKPIRLEAFKDRIWPLLFGADTRGESERREPMEVEIPK